MLAYTHRPHPRAKHLKLRLEPDGELIVTTPKRTSAKRIEKFIQSKSAWIKKQRQKIKANQVPVVTNDSVWLFGQERRRQSLELDQAHDLKKLDQFIKKTARAYFEPKAHHLSQKMDVSYNRIFLRQQKTRWGSCSGKNNLNFNWRLVHLETGLIDYVIIHELAHLKERNHSAKFWQLVKQFDPEYKTHRTWLKKHHLVVL